MKRIVMCLWGVLCLSFAAHAQPDDAPGLAVIPRNPSVVVPAPPTPEQIRAATRAAYNTLLNPVGKLDLSNPEATARSFVWSFYNADIKTARECVKDAQPYEKLGEIEKLLQKGAFVQQGYDEIRVLVTDFHSYVLGENAIVTFRLTQIYDPKLVFAGTLESPNLTGNILVSCERLHLKRDAGNWLIAENYKSVDLSAEQERGVVEDLLARMTSLLTHPEQTTARTALSECQNHLKQIGLGILQFVQDFNERFDLHTGWQNQIMPYVKAEESFHCPDAKEGEPSYAFNTKLENKLIGDIAQPAQTIMVYEGKDRKFEFRHNNKTLTNILFADGHVKSFTTQHLTDGLAVGAVRWKP
jgi:prepilin-type processing-associated H-X9-DG protein